MIKVALDCIVQPKLKKEGQSLNKLSSFRNLAAALSPQCQFLIFTNEEPVDVENTNDAEIYSVPSSKNLLHHLKLNRLLKQQISKWNADVVVSAGSLPYFHQKTNVFLVESCEEPSASAIKKMNRAKKIFASSAFIQQHLINNHHVPADNIIVTPFDINSLHKPIIWEEKENIKSIYSSGAEFFLYDHIPSAEQHFIQLLKAFSIFKKRLQTNMKLLIACSSSSTNKQIHQLLASYKFKEDVLFTGDVTTDQLATITAAAYTVILSAEKESLSQVQDVIQCKIPLLILQPEHWIKDENSFEYANQRSVEEIAGKLMLLYKDEAHRNKLIKASEQVLPQFTLQATAKTFHEALLLAATE